MHQLRTPRHHDSFVRDAGSPGQGDESPVLKGKLQAWRNDGCKAFFKIAECTATVAFQSGRDEEVERYLLTCRFDPPALVGWATGFIGIWLESGASQSLAKLVVALLVQYLDPQAEIHVHCADVWAANQWATRSVAQ